MRVLRFRPPHVWLLTALVLILPGVVAAEDIEEVVLFDNNNPAGVSSAPTQPTVFDVAEPMQLTYVMTYHWNRGRGERPGSIALVDEQGHQLGPWRARGRATADGVPPRYWTCRPNVKIPAGRWVVVDSDPASWSQNAPSGHAGIAVIRGRPWVEPPEAAVEAAIQANPAGVLPLLNARVAAHPDDADAWRLRAMAHGLLARGDAASEHAGLQREALDRVVALRPTDPEPLARRAWLRLVRGDQEGSSEDYAKAARLDPETPLRHADHAFALMGSGRRRDAADAYGRALALARADPNSLLAQGTLLEILGDTRAAEEGYRYLVTILPWGPQRTDALQRLAALAQSTPPSPPVQPPQPPRDPGDVLARGSVGPEGGRVGGPAGVTLDFPAGVLESTAEIVVRRAASSAGPTTLIDVDVQGARTRLGTPIRVTLDMPKGLDPTRVRPALRVGEDLWVQLPGGYDATTGRLTFETPHFSDVGGIVEDTGNLKWALGTGLVAVAIVGGGWCIAGSFSAMYAAAASMTLLETAVTTAATFFFGKLLGDAAYDETRAKLLGLDKVFAVPGFRILYTDDPTCENAVKTSDWGTAMFAREGNAFAGFAQGKVGPSNFQDGDKYTFVHVPWPLVGLAFELMLTRHYYAQAGYKVRPVTWVWTYAMGPGRDGAQYGSWEAAADELLGGVLNVNTAFLGAGSTAARRAMVAHESWHSIARANGLSNAHAAWVDEAVAWALEGTVFEHTMGFLKDRSWAVTAPELRRGLRFDGDEDAVRRGTFLWPFARFLLHRGGHEDVRDLASGRLAKTPRLFVQQWRAFARSLLAEEHRLADTYEQEPPVVTRDGTAIDIASGWQAPVGDAQGLDLNDLAPTTVRPGVIPTPSEMAAPRPLSLAFYRAYLANPPPEVDGELPPLVFRRATPSDAEEFAVLKPMQGPASTTSRPRALGDVRIEPRVVVAPGAWLGASGARAGLLPLAVVGVEFEDRGPASPLYLYWLDAPRFEKSEPLPDNPLWTRLHFVSPRPGGAGEGDLSPSDCYEQVQLVGFDEQGGEHVIMTAPEHFPLDPKDGKGYVDVSHLNTGQYETLGFVALDKEAKGDDGEPLRSPARKFDNPSIPDARYPVVGIMGELAFEFVVTGTIKENGATDESTWKLEHGLEDTTWQGRRHTDSWENHGFQCHWDLRMALGDEKFTSVTLQQSRDEPDRKVLQRFVLRDVPQIHIADLGPEGPLLRFYGVKGAGLVKQVTESRSDGSGAYDEIDPVTSKPRRVTYTTTFKGWKASDSWLMITVVSMTWEDLKAKVKAGLLDEETFQEQWYAAMEAARAALEGAPDK